MPVSAQDRDAPAREAASVKRRIAAFTYEGVLLFAVIFMGTYLYDSLTQHRHALHGRTGLQIYLFVLIGIYFVWFWTHGGQTLAMKTWRVQLVSARDHAPVGLPTAIMRYVVAWLWIMPALVLTWLHGSLPVMAVLAVVLVGIVAYAGLARLHPDRQFMHDAIVGTRLIRTPLSAQTRIE